MINEKAI